MIYANSHQDTYESVVHAQVRAAVAEHGEGDLHALINEGDTWVVGE